MRGDIIGQPDTKKYSKSHVKSILDAIGVKISGETGNDFLCFCPIHSNRHTPSLSVSKTKDRYLCFNSDCGSSGTLVDLVSEVSKRNYFESLRFVMQHQPTEQEDFESELETVLSESQDYREFSPEVLNKLIEGMADPESPGRAYMHGRGFTDDTIDYFEIGCSTKKNMVTVPVHSPNGLPVGVVGRIADRDRKTFKNSVGLPISRTFFNIHRAKRTSSTVILTEAGYDTMAVHQSGFPNVIGNLGGQLGPIKYNLLDKYFDRIILFTDNRDYDEAGRAIGMKVAERFISTKDILWAQYRYDEHYPNNLKDASAILESFDEKHVADTIAGAIPHFELMSMV